MTEARARGWSTLLLLLVPACGAATPSPSSAESTRLAGTERPTRAEDAAPSDRGPEPLPLQTLEARIQAVHARAGRGRPAVSELHEGTLSAGESRDFSLTLRQGRCYTIIGVGSGTVTDLDLFLYDPEGSLVSWDRARDATPLLTTCLPRTATYRLLVKMYAGSGEYGIQVFGSRAPRAPALEGTPLEIPIEEGDSPESSTE